jgi:hypothetical protein
MVGVGRDLDVQSGSGAELYVVIGHAPRHLDRNVALVHIELCNVPIAVREASASVAHSP